MEETSETSPGKENRLNQQKEEMLKKEMEAKTKEASKKRPNRGSDASNKSKRRKRIQVHLLLQKAQVIDQRGLEYCGYEYC